MKLAIIGGGNLGTAIAAGVLKSGVCTRDELLMYQRSEARAKKLREELGCVVTLTQDLLKNSASFPAIDALILAVKPQDLSAVAAQYSSLLTESTLLISVMAGVSSEVLRALFPTPKTIVRTMPNLPVQIGEGLTTYFSPTVLSSTERSYITAIFKPLGEILELTSDAAITASTAISGSGPGYFFYFAECLEKAAHTLGFSPADARRLVAHTFTGSALLHARSGKELHELKESVRSKGGTTDAAFKVFDARNIQAIIEEAASQACRRAVELSAEVKKRN